MFDELLKELKLTHNKNVFTFRIKSLSGKSVEINRQIIHLDFDINDLNQLELIMAILTSILENNNIVSKDQKLVNTEVEQKLEDFDTLINLLNKYKEED